MQQQVVSKGSRAVVILSQGGSFDARLYVGARDGIANASATPTAKSFKTAVGANRWAAKQVAA